MANRIPQPRTVNYNKVRTFWTDEQCEYLIDQRICKNEEFWELASRERDQFWNSIAGKINECFATRYTGVQIKTKWKNLLCEYLVSIVFYID